MCKPNYMKLFILYSIVANIVMVPLFFGTNKIFHIGFANGLNNLSIVFNYTFLVFFILFSMPDRKGITLMIIGYAISTCMIFFLLINKNLKIPIQSAFALNHFGLICYGTVYLIKIFFKIPEKLITEIPSFWVVMGVLICSTLSFPFVSILDFLRQNGIVYNNLLILNLPNIGYSIMYLFFIKAFKCSTRK